MQKILVLLAAVALMCAALSAAPASASARTKCHEDERCWNWATMGNHKRGVVADDGTWMVVTPCQFQFLWRTHYVMYVLRWTDRHGRKHHVRLNPHLRGDHLARTADCD